MVSPRSTRTWRESRTPMQASRGEARERFQVLGACAGDDFRRKLRPRGSLVPVERFQIVADELLVEGGRAYAFLICVRRPETRGVRRQDFVDERQRAVGALRELELGVGDDDAAFARMFRSELI